MHQAGQASRSQTRRRYRQRVINLAQSVILHQLHLKPDQMPSKLSALKCSIEFKSIKQGIWHDYAI